MSLKLPMFLKPFSDIINQACMSKVQEVERHHMKEKDEKALRLYETFSKLHENMPIIVVSLETGEITLAKITGYYKFDYDSPESSIPMIYSFSEKKELICFSSYKRYSHARLSALCNLAPYERASIFWHNLSPDNDLKDAENTSNIDEILAKANENGFSECVEEYSY